MEQTLIQLTERVERLESVVRTLLKTDVDKRSQKQEKVKAPKQKHPCQMCGTEMAIFPKLPCGHKIRKKCLIVANSFGDKFALTECPICNQHLGDSLIENLNKSLAKKPVTRPVQKKQKIDTHQPEEQPEECNVTKLVLPVVHEPPTMENEEWDSEGLDDLVEHLNL